MMMKINIKKSSTIPSSEPIAGRLDRDEIDKIVINCNIEGVLFIEAKLDSTLDTFGEFTSSPESAALLRLLITLTIFHPIHYFLHKVGDEERVLKVTFSGACCLEDTFAGK
ncbi:unnamed protein product [Lactuca virosa]|uniref:Uncharacterized protein n=1 Tax=Lactuca virosa TaxID=75947 RepID=A0AAU9MY69_9ASTR|nr:unnamed protein product [Lactuca virosa]